MKGSLELVDVYKDYRIGRRHAWQTLKGALFHRSPHGGLGTKRHHTALAGVTMAVRRGEVVGIIGPNGSGKSTLLKLIGGILRPTRGSVRIEGRVTALIELGAGFHPEVTGRENIIINGMLLGLSRNEIEQRLPDIVDFAEIGEFIDYPVKTYSSGMYVRLGFAVAISAAPDVLLIDEVLAVGDEAFTGRCLDRLAHMRRNGVTMIIVSHDLDLIGDLAERAVYLDRGIVAADGPADVVVARYRNDVAGKRAAAELKPEVRVLEEGRRWGTGQVEIATVEILSGKQPTRVVPSGASCTVRIGYRAKEVVEDFVFGIAWHRADGTHVAGHNTMLDGMKPARLEEDGTIACDYDEVALAPGEYHLDVAVHARDGLAYDYWCRAARLRVTAAADWPGIWAPCHRWSSSSKLWV